MTNREVIEAWSTAGEQAAEFGEEGDFARQHLLNPTIFAMLGPVQGRHILDAGFGQGYLSRLLARRGATVTGVEPADGWYQYAADRETRERLGITYVQADLAAFDAPASFDAVVANMVLMDIPDLAPALHACVAALVPGGSLIFSISHPCFEESNDAWAGKRYVEVREYLHDYPIQQQIGQRFHRPLSVYLNLVAAEGCRLREVAEPGLDAELASRGPADERNVHVPNFVVVHATKG